MLTLIYSIIAGLIIGMPVGIAGALVADSALAHNRKRLISTIIAVSLGDLILAFVVGLFFRHIADFINAYESYLYLAGGVLLASVAVALTFKAMKQDSLPDPHAEKGPFHYILTHYAPSVSAFLLALLHPGSLIAMAAASGIVVSKLPEGEFKPILFALGIGVGSMFIFAISGVAFWKIRKKAGNFVRGMRFCLAIMIYILCGIMFYSYINSIQQEPKKSYEQRNNLSSDVSDSQSTL